MFHLLKFNGSKNKVSRSNFVSKCFASGHTASFSDPKMDCKECKTRERADNIIEDYAKKHNNINKI